jgi:hypothetical protein
MPAKLFSFGLAVYTISFFNRQDLKQHNLFSKNKKTTKAVQIFFCYPSWFIFFKTVKRYLT